MRVLANQVVASILILTISAPTLGFAAPGEGQNPRPRPTGNPGENPGPRPTHPGPRPTYTEPAPQPTPTKTATPTPTPTPSPVPTVSPTAVPSPVPTVIGPTDTQINAARALGIQDGASPGAHEGLERAPREAKHEGARDGRAHGYQVCEREEVNRARDAGFRDGYAQGQTDGSRTGTINGQNDGRARGQADGNTDGYHRADKQSAADASGPGRQRGVSEANASDATARGNTDGNARGDSDARAEAERVEYPRGHRDVKAEKQNEPIKSEDSFDQKAPVTPSSKQSLAKYFGESTPFKAIAAAFGYSTQDERRGDNRDDNRDGRDDPNRPGDHDRISAKPDYRYSNPTRTFPSEQEQKAYQQGYTQGYNDNFEKEYGRIYRREYREAFQLAERQGCESARSRDYREFYNHAYREARDKGYSDTYQIAYNSAYRAMYEETFALSTSQSYDTNYPVLYDKHFEEYRSAAYRAQYSALYDRAFSASHDATYQRVYPGYAQNAYQRGRADEEADFAQRPVRLLDAVPTETIENGLYEPGEVLRIRLSMRNHSPAVLAGKDIKVVLQALDSGSAVISTAQETLVQNVRAKSVTTVREALEFRMNENAAGRTRQFRITLYYQGRNVGEQVFSVVTRFATTLEFAEAPKLREGLESPIRVKIRNESGKPTDPSLKVTFVSRPEILEVIKGSIQVGVLNPGEERVLEFSGIARAHGTNIRVPYVFESTMNGRRVGLNDGEDSIPLVNDYRISVSADTRAMRGNGVIRVHYTITNVSSRLFMKSLQLKTRVLGGNAQNFVIIGPNPQYLSPLITGQSADFEVPILSKGSNSGGTLELEVQEDGQTVTISQTDF